MADDEKTAENPRTHTTFVRNGLAVACTLAEKRAREKEAKDKAIASAKAPPKAKG